LRQHYAYLIIGTMTATTETAVELWLKARRRNCAILMRGDPAPIDAGGATYFGGQPKLAPGLAWPTMAIDGAEASMLFLGQIELSDLPHFERRQLLPQRGTLYFFYVDRWDWEGDRAGIMPCAVLYYEGCAVNFRPTPPPLPLAPENPDLGEMGVHPDDGARFGISFAAYDSFPDDNELEFDELSRPQRESVEKVIEASRLEAPHQLLGHACCEHVFVGAEQMPGRISLLRISSGETIFRGSPGYTFEGAFNFWIAPEDLARCDFANVSLSC
jgi:hypothetical protein